MNDSIIIKFRPDLTVSNIEMDFSLNDFQTCFTEKFPYSILGYPCLPCAGDDQANYLWYLSLVVLISFFLIKWAIRNNFIYTEWLNNHYLIPYYFIGFYTLLIGISIAYLNWEENKWTIVIPNTVGFAILFSISCLVSLKFYDYLAYLPVFGTLLVKITSLVERWMGRNAPRILVSWWGIALVPVVMLFPVIGPYLAGGLAFFPENLFLMWMGYIYVCLIKKI